MPATSWAIDASAGGRSGVLLDRVRGVRWESGFLSTTRHDLFLSVHEPTTVTPRGALVICSPILAEAARNYRREVLVADQLAERGVSTARFHYGGAGHSDDVDDMNLDRLVDDARRVADHMLERTGVAAVAVLGTRLGALVAARLHAEHPGAPVVLWDAALDGTKYMRDLLRARMMTNLKSGSGVGGVGALRGELKAGHPVEISGYVLTPELYRSVLGADLGSALGDPDGPLAIHELNGGGRARPGVDDLLQRWEQAGHATQTSVVPVDEPWWFGASARMDTYEGQATATTLVTSSVDFLDGCITSVSQVAR